MGISSQKFLTKKKENNFLEEKDIFILINKFGVSFSDFSKQLKLYEQEATQLFGFKNEFYGILIEKVVVNYFIEFCGHYQTQIDKYVIYDICFLCMICCLIFLF